MQDALAQASAANHDTGNPILAALDQVQERLDLARLRLPADARHDKMFDVARQFIDHARGAAASGNWNLVQTFETAADVSLQEAAQPAGARHALTERFMHKEDKHDITVDPNSADPFATFQDHSKGKDDVGAIVEAVGSAVVNVAAVFQPYLWPAAVAVDTAQAGQSFAGGNVLGGVLSLASAVGLNGLGNGSSLFGLTAGDLGLSAAGAKSLGAGVLAAAAAAGGTNAVVQAAQRGDGLGIAAGLLQVAAAAADGTIAGQGGGSADLKLGALGLSVAAGATRLADGAQTGDLATALADVGALAAAVAAAVQQVKADPQLQARFDQFVNGALDLVSGSTSQGGSTQQTLQQSLLPTLQVTFLDNQSGIPLGIPDNDAIYKFIQQEFLIAKPVGSADTKLNDPYVAAAASPLVFQEAVKTGTFFSIPSKAYVGGAILLQAEGTASDPQSGVLVKGIYEYIVPINSDLLSGSPILTHQRFIPNAPISGYPNNFNGKYPPFGKLQA